MRVSIELPDKDYQLILTQIMLVCRGYAITTEETEWEGSEEEAREREAKEKQENE